MKATLVKVKAMSRSRPFQNQVVCVLISKAGSGPST